MRGLLQNSTYEDFFQKSNFGKKAIFRLSTYFSLKPKYDEIYIKTRISEAQIFFSEISAYLNAKNKNTKKIIFIINRIYFYEIFFG